LAACLRPASAVAFALIDVVPHIAARETHERPGEVSVIACLLSGRRFAKMEG